MTLPAPTKLHEGKVMGIKTQHVYNLAIKKKNCFYVYYQSYNEAHYNLKWSFEFKLQQRMHMLFPFNRTSRKVRTQKKRDK